MTESPDSHDDPLLNLSEEATEALSKLSEEDRSAYAEEAERAGHVLAYAALILGDSTPALVPAEARTQAEQALVELRDSTSVGLTPPTAADQLLEALSRYPASRGRDAQQAATEIAERFQRSTAQRLRSVERDASDARTKLQQGVDKTASKVEELTTSAEARAAEIDQRIADLSASIDAIRTATDEQLRQQQERFTAKEDEYETANNQLRAEQEKELVQIRQRQETAAKEHLEKMEALRDRAAGFLDVIANSGMASQFQDRANKDERQAGRYRVATIAIGLGAVALAAVLVLLGEQGPEYAFAKFGIVTTMLLVAGFTGNHARRKQTAAEGWREFELKLSGFGAVLETLPPDQAEEEQRWLFRELFARKENKEPDGRLAGRLRRVDQDRDAA